MNKQNRSGGYKTVNAALKSEIIAMHEVKGLSFRAIGEELGIAEGTAKTNYYLSRGQATAKQRIPDSPYPRYDDPPTLDGDALVIPDSEIPFHHAEFMNRVFDIADAWNIKQCIWAGDALHFDSLSGWEPNWKNETKHGLDEKGEGLLMEIAKSLPKNHQQKLINAIIEIGENTEERGFSGEMVHARNTLNAIKDLFNKNVWVLGNHECLDTETEVFSDGEWKSYKDLVEGQSKVLVYNDGVISEEIVEKIHEYDYSGVMYHTKTMLTDMMVSPNHRILWHPQLMGWRYDEAEKIYKNNKLTRMYLPLAGNIKTSGTVLSDDQIKIAAWIYTDCSISKKTGYYQFSQRKSKVNHITEILDRLNISYSLYERERTTSEICGKRLLKKPENEITVVINADSSRELQKIIFDKSQFADWIWQLDDRQFEIFLYAFIDGDGSIHKDYPTSLMIYCNREKLAGQIQALCIQHGYRATISRYNGNNIRINIVKRKTITLDDGYARNTKQVNYSGKIWCLTVPSGNFLVRRNGRPVFTGNSRLMRSINSPLQPSELINLMRLDEGRWTIAPYYFAVLNTPRGKYRIEHPKAASKGAAEKLAAKFQCHVLMGHSHLLRADWDASGHYHACHLGHCVDEDTLAYAAQRSNTRDAHMLGAAIVRDGYLWMLHEMVDWERMKRMA